MNVLVVNAGSSSLKLRLLDESDNVVATTDVQRWDGEPEPVTKFAAEHGPVDAVGHRVVHGGPEFAEPTVVDEAVLERIEALTDLAPLHQPRALAGIAAAREALPDAAHVACFDTTFHRTLPQAAATYALPASWRRQWGLRRYGFHGLSHAYASRRAAQLLDQASDELRVVTCHLGAGASLCAVNSGRSVDTTMGFTPLEGLVMATRAGDVDPGLLLWLLQHRKLTVDELADGLEHHSGLAGLAEGPADMRDIRRAARQGSATATLALEVFHHRLRKEIAATTATMNGLDVLVFTGGIGEHDPDTRAAATSGLRFLGAEIDPDRNARATADRDLSTPDAAVRVLVIQAREDLEIAAQTRHANGS